jgi:hypothetical protein
MTSLSDRDARTVHLSHGERSDRLDDVETIRVRGYGLDDRL